jgi:hypothetical protein
MEWFRYPTGRVRVLRRAAAVYAAHGWPVVPGAYAVGGQCGCSRLGCRRAGLHPLLEQWEQAATTDVLQVGRWWARQAWAILLRTGPRVEVVDVSADVGAATAHRLSERAGPIALSGGHRWLLFCAAEEEPVDPTDDDWRAGLLVHTQGSWVPVPADGRMRGRAGWLRPPWLVGWRLPGTREVLAAARAAVAGLSGGAPASGGFHLPVAIATEPPQ